MQGMAAFEELCKTAVTQIHLLDVAGVMPEPSVSFF